MTSVGAIVMAAGLGKRMRSKIGKVLHPVAGRPMLLYAVDLAGRFADDGVVVVVGHQAERVKAVLDEFAAERGLRAVPSRGRGLTAHVASPREPGGAILIAEQREQLGTGHAVMQARHAIMSARGRPARTYLIMNGDTPLLTETALAGLLKVHEEEKAAVTLLTAVPDDPSGYGRIIRGQGGTGAHRVLKIVEDRDATPDEARVREINVGTYVVDGRFLFEALDELKPQNVQREYYLTDLVTLAVRRGLPVSAMAVERAEEGLGVNSRRQLAHAERVLRERIRDRWMQEGVTLLDPATAWIDDTVRIGQDTVLHPHVTLEGRTVIGQDCVIRSHSRLTDTTLGDHVVVQDCCVLTDSCVEEGCAIGPFAHLRPGSIVRRRAKVGNFVEMKKTELGEGSKANHLSYLGDARIGKNVNIGAGTITCNYDGYRKYETVIDDDVFIGSDTQLIAPVKVGRGAVIAAGTSVTQEVPPDALAISRTPQANRFGWASKRRALLEGQPDSSAGRGPQGNPKKARPSSGAARPPSRAAVRSKSKKG